jgi:TolA-binding protein
MDETDRQRLAFVCLSLSCLTGAYLIAQLQKRVRYLEGLTDAMSDVLDMQMQHEFDEKFEEIVEDLREE